MLSHKTFIQAIQHSEFWFQESVFKINVYMYDSTRYPGYRACTYVYLFELIIHFQFESEMNSEQTMDTYTFIMFKLFICLFIFDTIS